MKTIEVDEIKEKAFRARAMYRAGKITRAEALEEMEDYIELFDARSREIAKKYGQRPRLFSFAAFMR